MTDHAAVPGTDPGGGGVVTLETLRQRCDDAARQIVQTNLATVDEVNALLPGGAKNPDTSATGWLVAFGQLHRLHAAGTAGTAGAARVEMLKQLAPNPDVDREVMAAMRSASVRVDLVHPLRRKGARGEKAESVTHVVVRPKSIEALLEMHAWDCDLVWVEARRQVLEAQRAPEHRALLLACTRRVQQIMRILVYIATTGRWEDGIHIPAACPYEPDAMGDHEPTPPRWMRDLDAFDVTRILRASLYVNKHRTALLYALYPGLQSAESATEQPSWSLFAAGAAKELGTDSSVLQRHWDLGRAVAAAGVLAGRRLEAEREAEAKAKRDARRR